MGRNEDDVQKFLDGIPDDKFCTWATKQYIKDNYKFDMRLDLQSLRSYRLLDAMIEGT